MEMGPVVSKRIQERTPVARRLKQARLSKGLSQKNLGITAGIDEFSASARVNQYEREKHAPDFLTLSRLAEALSTPVTYFFAEDDELAELILLFSQVSEPERAEMLSLLRDEIQR